MERKSQTRLHFEHAMSLSLEYESRLCEEICSLPKGSVREKHENGKAYYALEYSENHIRRTCALTAVEAADFKTRIRRRNDLVTKAKAALWETQHIIKAFQTEKWELSGKALAMINRSPKYYDNLKWSLDLHLAPKDDWLKDLPVVKDAGPFRPEGLKFKTLDEIMVRSKNEAVVSNEFCHANFEYRYELPLLLDGQIFRPDFIVCHPYTNLPYIVDVGGMMDNEKYKRNLIEKITLYDKYGFRFGDRYIGLFCNSNELVDVGLLHQMLDDRHFFGR